MGAEFNSVGRHTSQGEAYVFARSGSAWRQAARLTASDGAEGDFFGSSVALSGNGSVVLVGAPESAQGTYWGYQGAAYVFQHSGNAWRQTGEFTCSDLGEGTEFGSALALSEDGGTALIGAPGASDTGLAYLFTRSGGKWRQTKTLLPADGGDNDGFGTDVALSANGAVALVGSPRHAESARSAGGTAYLTVLQGRAYAYTRTGSVWRRAGELSIASQEPANSTFGVNWATFGVSLALDDTGATLLIGAGIGNGYAGAGYVFTRGGK